MRERIGHAPEPSVCLISSTIIEIEESYLLTKQYQTKRGTPAEGEVPETACLTKRRVPNIILQKRRTALTYPHVPAQKRKTILNIWTRTTPSVSSAASSVGYSFPDRPPPQRKKSLLAPAEINASVQKAGEKSSLHSRQGEQENKCRETKWTEEV